MKFGSIVLQVYTHRLTFDVTFYFQVAAKKSFHIKSYVFIVSNPPATHCCM